MGGRTGAFPQAVPGVGAHSSITHSRHPPHRRPVPVVSPDAVTPPPAPVSPPSPPAEAGEQEATVAEEEEADYGEEQVEEPMAGAVGEDAGLEVAWYPRDGEIVELRPAPVMAVVRVTLRTSFTL